MFSVHVPMGRLRASTCHKRRSVSNDEARSGYVWVLLTLNQWLTSLPDEIFKELRTSWTFPNIFCKACFETEHTKGVAANRQLSQMPSRYGLNSEAHCSKTNLVHVYISSIVLIIKNTITILSSLIASAVS